MSSTRQPVRSEGMWGAISAHLKAGKLPRRWCGAVSDPSGRCRLWNHGPSAAISPSRSFDGAKTSCWSSFVIVNPCACGRGRVLDAGPADVALQLRGTMGGGVPREHLGARAAADRRPLELIDLVEVAQRVARGSCDEYFRIGGEEVVEAFPLVAHDRRPARRRLEEPHTR